MLPGDQQLFPREYILIPGHSLTSKSEDSKGPPRVSRKPISSNVGRLWTNCSNSPSTQNHLLLSDWTAHSKNTPLDLVWSTTPGGWHFKHQTSASRNPLRRYSSTITASWGIPVVRFRILRSRRSPLAARLSKYRKPFRFLFHIPFYIC